MTNYISNPKYKTFFDDFFLNIKLYFNTNKNTIHKARNELKVINYNNTEVVVKSFKIPNIINRIVYTFFKQSKAEKSFLYSLKIGSFTPSPIGFIEFKKNFLLKESYFVSEKFAYDFTIREPLLSADFLDRENIFRAFAKFTFSLHENNILHFDYSPGNILIKKHLDGYEFKIVDINRMKFIQLSQDERLKNFSKLWMNDSDMEIVVKEYALLGNYEIADCVKKAINFSQKHKNKINMKKRLKGIKVVD